MNEFDRPQQTHLETLKGFAVSHAPDFLRKTGAVILSAVALGGGTAEAKTSAQSLLPPQTIGSLYSSETTQHVLATLQEDLASGSGLVISSAQLSPSSFQAQGDCSQGSAYNSWIDNAGSLLTVGCDGTQNAAPSVNTASTFSNELEKIGSVLVTSIPGESIDLKQQVSDLKVSSASAEAMLNCLRMKSGKYTPPASKEILLDSYNKATQTFCPREDVLDLISKTPNTSDFSHAFEEFKNDPLRNSEWGGDSYKENMLYSCPNIPLGYNPLLSARIQKNKSIKAKFNSVSTLKYCDKVGQYSSEAVAQIKQKGKRRYTQLGRSALHIDSLKEILVFGSSTYFPSSYQAVKVSLPGSKINCHAEKFKKASVRIKLIERFTGMKTQDFVHTSAKFKNSTKSFYTRERKVC